jgi:hypothetical protein
MSDLTAADVAEELGIPEWQVKKLTVANGWPHLRYSRKTVRYTPEHIEQIKAIQETKPATPPVVGIAGQTSRSRAAR